MANRGKTVIATLLVSAVVVAVVVAAAVLSGAYSVAGDAPHSGLVFSLLQTMRVRSIAAQASGIAAPDDLGDAKRIAAGASEYAEMCSQCHLAPGMEKTEISQGLYPSAPELARGDSLTAAEQFWVVKHGIKFTAMPAWGVTHDDRLIWNMVAFVRKLPSLTPAQYKQLTANSSEEHEHMMQDMPGMSDDDHRDHH